MAEKRFQKTFSQGMVDGFEIWVDTTTGVNYLFRTNGNSGGLTPLLGPTGEVVITKPSPKGPEDFK